MARKALMLSDGDGREGFIGVYAKGWMQEELQM